jgi:hypothetical protein
MCTAENVTYAMQRINKEYPPNMSGRCGGCNGTQIEKDENCEGDPNVIFCRDCDAHNLHVIPNFDDCCIITCNSCNNKICAACDNIGYCVKCNMDLCDDCAETFWCYECEHGYCKGCEECVCVDDVPYCKPCSVKHIL